MNNEIKEILEQLEWYRKIGKKDVYYPECVLPNKKAFILLDYITNLQQENERLKETNVYCNRTDCIGRIKDSKKYDSVYQEKEDYKSRCEKAKDKLRRDYYTNYTQHNDDVVREVLNILQNGSDIE